MDPPIKPDESDCCGSGCNPCILDIYEQQYKKYLQGSVNISRLKNCISETSYTTFLLTSVSDITDDTKLFTFIHKSDDENNIHLFFDPGQHFLIKSLEPDDPNKHFTRAYTPIYRNKKSFTILVKIYENGKMSRYFQNLKPNDETLWRGPYGGYQINFELKNLLMICQGTGIAPLYTILNKLLENEECESFIKLFYCCNNIYLHDELYRLKSYWNFTYELFLSNSKCKTKYGEVVHNRRLISDDISSYLENKNRNSLEILICGSDLFINTIKNILLHFNVNKECIFVF